MLSNGAPGWRACWLWRMKGWPRALPLRPPGIW